MLKAIVFDFDGVIVDSEPLHYRAFLHVAGTLGLSFSYQQYLEEYVGFDDRDAFRHMLAQRSGKVSVDVDPVQLADLCLAKGRAFVDVVEQGIEPIAGMPELVREAAGHLPIAIASGATRADIDLILAKLDLAECFGVIVTADDVARSKPDPTSYRMAVERLAQRHADLNLQPGHCLAIEDTAAGIQSARGAGLMTLGLATTSGPEVLHQAQRVTDPGHGITLAQLRKWYGG